MHMLVLLGPTAGPEFKAFQKISVRKILIAHDSLGNIFQYKSYLTV